MRRVLMLVAAAAIPASAAFVALDGGQAFAKGPNGKVTCSTISGTASGTITVSGCSDSGSATGLTATEPIEATALATGGTIHWTTAGDTSTFGAPTLTPTNAKHCPGYVKDAATEPTAEKFAGSVTSSSPTGLKNPGTFKGEVCIGLTGNITNPKPLKAS
jgi:hypothetical protein